MRYSVSLGSNDYDYGISLFPIYSLIPNNSSRMQEADFCQWTETKAPNRIMAAWESSRKCQEKEAESEKNRKMFRLDVSYHFLTNELFYSLLWLQKLLFTQKMSWYIECVTENREPKQFAVIRWIIFWPQNSSELFHHEIFRCILWIILWVILFKMNTIIIIIKSSHHSFPTSLETSFSAYHYAIWKIEHFDGGF